RENKPARPGAGVGVSRIQGQGQTSPRSRPTLPSVPTTWKGPLPPDDPIFTEGINFVFKRPLVPLTPSTAEEDVPEERAATPQSEEETSRCDVIAPSSRDESEWP